MDKLRISLRDIMLFAVALLSLLISGTVIYSIDRFGQLRDSTLIVLFVVQLFLIIKDMNTSIRIKKRLALIVLGALLFFGVSVFINPSSTVNFFSKILMFIFFCCIFYNQRNADKILRCLYNIIVAISIIAIIFFVGIYIFNLPLPNTQLNNGFYRSYLYLFYDAEVYRETIGPHAYYRLQGIFWEPGVFGIYLILGIFYYSFLDEEKDERKLCALLLCLLLTSSTTGIFLGVFVVAVLFLCKFKKLTNRLLVCVPLGILTIIVGFYLLMAKKNGGGGYSASYVLRMVDFCNSLDIWKKHFLFGTGYNNVSEFEAATIIWNRQNSNGFMNWCMTMGLWGMIVQLLPFFVNVIKRKGRQKLIHIAFAIVYVGINMTEPLITSPLMIMLLSLDYVIMAKQMRGVSVHGFERKEICINMS